MNTGTEKRDWHTIQPFKGRTIDFDKKVRVYRCLNRKSKSYSIQQDGLVVGHATHLSLMNCKFIVNSAGSIKCKTTGKRNVHAFIEGKISRFGIMGVDALSKYSELPAKITYNPYEDSAFMCVNITQDPFSVSGARGVIINENGVSAAYILIEKQEVC